MKVSEALNTVSKHYIPGVAKFYEQMRIDPWQKAHDDLQSQMAYHAKNPDYEQLISEEAKKFVDTCITLINNAKPFVEGKKPNLMDAFVIADDEKLQEYISKTADACLTCGAKQNIRMVAKNRVKGVYCVRCVP